MDAQILLQIALICFAGGFVHLACGFGFSMVAMGTLTILMSSFGEAAALANLLMLAVSLCFAVRLRGNIRWKVILWPVLGYLPVMALMSYVLDVSPGNILRILLGIGLILLACYMIFLQNRLSVPLTPLAGILIGSVAGLLGGLFCMAGVPMAMYLLSIDQKEDYLASSQAFYLTTTCFAALIHRSFGFFTQDMWQALCCGIPAVLLGAVLGRSVFHRINQTVLKRVIYGFMLLSGLSLIMP